MQNNSANIGAMTVDLQYFVEGWKQPNVSYM